MDLDGSTLHLTVCWFDSGCARQQNAICQEIAFVNPRDAFFRGLISVVGKIEGILGQLIKHIRVLKADCQCIDHLLVPEMRRVRAICLTHYIHKIWIAGYGHFLFHQQILNKNQAPRAAPASARGPPASAAGRFVGPRAA